MTKKQLADRICQALYQNEYVWADRDSEERDPEESDFERIGYVKLTQGNGETVREHVTFYFDSDDNPTFVWDCFDPFNLEGKDCMAAFLAGFMHALFGAAVLQEIYVRADQRITFMMLGVQQ